MSHPVPRPLRLETRRLLLVPLTASDATAFHAVNIDPGVRRYLFDDRVVTREDSGAILRRSLDLLARDGSGLFAAILRGDTTLIGWAGYLHSHEPPVLEIANALLPGYWGRGLAGEASCAVMTWGIRHLGLDAFRASADAANVASIRVLEKLGFGETHRTGPPERALVHFAIDAARVDQSGVVCVAA